MHGVSQKRIKRLKGDKNKGGIWWFQRKDLFLILSFIRIQQKYE
jgi:hypothetical protein